MANPQGLPNKGTLVPGQSIAVNKYNVQVERYLSQGGFAHVYLVRTATPVYNTTHHVLKRIAVANDAMLSEVKKEVDIMRLLKGHPNIVHLIDAAWHKMSDGLYEVFILMEFCPGGGIIDMMNRRLRERLTEAEILQIFVDVCEGVACMHNLRPALLHRDLKVENILQSSPSSFKLCDFGSATNVTRPPANTQEIRALEAELNRHTTLQYRAPEMVDPYLRRPVDEKSDIWALGVLLYKLCYYTTPFEEHGPLAILNVQYRIPPYPVYSVQMNTLIGSMLKEHGTQRPTVFELLTHVHHLRGTHSPFQYNIPPPVPPMLSPRKQQQFSSPSRSPAPHSLDNTISYRTAQQIAPSPKLHAASPATPTKNAGVQARDKVLDAIAPMRRGRPKDTAGHHSSRSVSPQKDGKPTKNWMDNDFAADEESAWKAATVKSALPQTQQADVNDGWSGLTPKKTPDVSTGFGDDFGEKLWDSFDPSNVLTSPTSAPVGHPVRAPGLPVSRGKDAFDGLGFGANTDRPPPTLGETRKLRTGLAGMSSTPEPRILGNKANDGGSSPRPTPSPRPSYLTASQSQSTGTGGSPGSSWKHPSPLNQPRSATNSDGMTAETRFPSLEELDATFGTVPSSAAKQSPSSVRAGISAERTPNLPTRPQGATSNTLHPTQLAQSSYGFDGTRSQQVTGTAMREVGSHKNPERGRDKPKENVASSSRPVLTRKHRSSVSIKRSSQLGDGVLGASSTRSPTVTSQPPTDWLTGEDDANSQLSPPPTASMKPVVRASPSKRASYIDKRDVPSHEASVAQYDQAPSPSVRKVPSSARATITRTPSLSVQRATRVLPPVKINATSTAALSDNWSPITKTHPRPSPKDIDSSSSADEGPEDVRGYAQTEAKSTDAGTKRPHRKGRQSSVHDLVDLWGGGAPKEELERSSAADLTPQPASKRHQGLPPLSTPTNVRSASPHGMLSPLGSSPRRTSSRSPKRESTHSRQPSSSGLTSGGRSRPQSMFIFPTSKSNNSDGLGGGLTSPGLVPPEHPTPRANTRRTSISDMVQRFEAIGTSTVKSPTPSSAVIAKPIALKANTDKYSRGDRNPAAPSRANKDLPVPDNFSPTTNRTSPTGLPRGSSVPSNTPLSEELGSPRYAFPPRKLTYSQETTPAGDGRSPSPEKPYQGVGKLIDQWQRKTVDAEPGRGARGGFVKRTGMVNGGTNRS